VRLGIVLLLVVASCARAAFAQPVFAQPASVQIGCVPGNSAQAACVQPAGVRAGEPPSFAQVRERHRSSEGWLLDRAGEPLQRLRLDPSVRQLEWVRLEDVSPALREAIVLSEDRRFHRHAGVDWLGVVAAVWRNLGAEGGSGASTISMQLAALLDPTLARGEGGRTLLAKWAQMRAAWALEAKWSKDEILEAYVNLVPFRGDAVGVDALARAYFGKHPAAIDRRQAALAAALVRAPGARPARVAHRACRLLARSGADSDCAGLDAEAASTLGRPRAVRAGVADAPHLARRLVHAPGERVVSTVDARLQRLARDTLTRHLRELAGSHVEDGAVLILDNATGEVLAWVGGSGALSEAPEVDAVTALRQAGSTLKPFLYARAIEGRWLTAASVLDDAPLTIATPVGSYVPQNYDRGFRGRVSVRTALGSSLNVPAVRALVMMGPDAFHERLRRLGFDSLRESGDYYGYSLALGSAEVSLAMLANAYRTLANGGRHSALRTTRGAVAAAGVEAAPDPAAEQAPIRPADQAPKRAADQALEPGGEQVLDPAAAFIVTDILADRNARVATFGLGSSLDTPQWSAVKTGTSKDMRDNWCVGFDDRYTVGVWVGNLSGAPMWDVSGASGAAPVWQAIMAELQRGRRVAPPHPPREVVRADIAFDDQLEPARQEVFVRGTELARVRLVSDAARDQVRIAYPAHGAVLALDPDMPPRNQGVFFSAHGGNAKGFEWRLDGRAYGPVQGAAPWLPFPGRHRLALLDARGRELDAVEFEVRGAIPRAGGLRLRAMLPASPSGGSP
jgi:penicillin-binding protein 1C